MDNIELLHESPDGRIRIDLDRHQANTANDRSDPDRVALISGFLGGKPVLLIHRGDRTIEETVALVLRECRVQMEGQFVIPEQCRSCWKFSQFFHANTLWYNEQIYNRIQGLPCRDWGYCGGLMVTNGPNGLEGGEFPPGKCPEWTPPDYPGAPAVMYKLRTFEQWFVGWHSREECEERGIRQSAIVVAKWQSGHSHRRGQGGNTPLKPEAGPLKRGLYYDFTGAPWLENTKYV